MENDNYLFISYSNKDRVFVNKLKNDLNNYGIKTWVDTDQIKPGTLWKDEIVKAINKSGIIIVVLSKYYSQSSWVQYEMSLSYAKKIIPINIDSSARIDIPDKLKNLHWLDFSNYNTGLLNLIENIPDNYKNHQLSHTNTISKGYVFISFCEEDSSFVLELRNFLKEQNFAYWDFEDGTRNYHVQFSLELESAIENSEAVLSIISPFWKNSKWSLREYMYAEEIGKPIFLLKIKDTKPTLAIVGQPFISFIDDRARGFIKLGKELSKRLAPEYENL